MTPQQYVKALRKFNLSIIGAADVFGISPRQSQRYASGTPIPRPLVKLIRITIKHHVPITDVTRA